jgi:hypothetical protein
VSAQYVLNRLLAGSARVAGIVGARPIINPYQPVWIDPQKVSLGIVSDTQSNKALRYEKRFGIKARVVGDVRSGDWDRSKVQFADQPYVVALRQRFVDGLDWDQTEYRRLFGENAEARGKYRGGRSWDDFKEKRLGGWDALFSEVKAHCQASGGIWQLRRPPEKLVEIAVDREGQICFIDGKHRLAMAKIVGAKAMPVICNIWHEDFIRRLRPYGRRGVTVEAAISCASYAAAAAAASSMAGGDSVPLELRPAGSI